MMQSIINHIVAQPPAAGHHVSFFRLDGTESVELRELYDRAGRLAVGLRAWGVRRGDRIGILAANSLEWVMLDLAALRLGAAIVGFDTNKFDIGSELLSHYRLALLFTDHPAKAARTYPMGEVRRLADRSDPGQMLPSIEYAPHDVTTLKLTSGSTGEPKGLTASVGSIDSALHAVQAMFAHGHGDNLLVFLPLAILQQRYWIYSALRFGHDVTVSTYEAAFPAMKRAAPTVVMGVPAFYATAKKHIEALARRGDDAIDAAARQLFGDRIRYLWTGSAPAGGDVLRFFNEVGLPIFEGYGLNETCIVSKNYPGACRVGSAGRVLPDKQVLLDEDGVISVRSDHPVARRYEYASPSESERVFGQPGVVRTGDLGYIDDDGFLFIRGRADDVIVLENGRKVIVRPIEEHIKASPAIAECVLFCPTQTQLVAVVSPAQQPADEAAIALQLTRTNMAFGHDEQIRKVVVAQSPFSIDNGLLTSQFKPRRNQIFQAYHTQIHRREGGIHAR